MIENDVEHESDSKQEKVVDMLLSSATEKTLDSESMILETQKRVWGALKKGYQYSGIVDESDQFLRKNVFSKLDLVVLYVDLVGSTTMTLEMPEEKIAIIISIKFFLNFINGYITITTTGIKLSTTPSFT